MDDLQPRGKHADYIHLLFTSEHHFHLKQFFEQLSQVKGVTPPQNTHFCPPWPALSHLLLLGFSHYRFSSLVLDLSERHWGPRGHQEYFKHPSHLPALWPAAAFQTQQWSLHPFIHLGLLRPDADLASISFQNVFFLSRSLSAAGHVVSCSFMFQRCLHLTNGLIKLQRSEMCQLGPTFMTLRKRFDTGEPFIICNNTQKISGFK